MSRPSEYPLSTVYVTYTDEYGRTLITKISFPHDGAQQAADEAIQRLFYSMGSNGPPPGVQIREIEVFSNVQPRRFFHERVIRPHFALKEQ